MVQSPHQSQKLDVGFFRTTGLVLVLGTLISGAITLSLTLSMANSNTAETIVSNILNEPQLLKKVGEVVGQLANVE